MSKESNENINENNVYQISMKMKAEICIINVNVMSIEEERKSIEEREKCGNHVM